MICARVMVLGIAMTCAAARAGATDLRISVPAIQQSATTGRTATVTVSWANGWRNAKNHDGVWLFVKTGKPGASLRHVRVAPAGHGITALSGPAGRLLLPEDRVGVFAVPDAEHRGRVEWRIQLALDPADDGPDGARVFGVEMVYVPAGPFTTGDPDPAAIEFNAVYRSDARGEPAGRLRVMSEGRIEVGPSDGALFYKTLLPQYEGDRLGPIPAAFPKGVAAL